MTQQIDSLQMKSIKPWILLLLLMALLSVVPITRSQEAEGLDLERIQRATVYVIQAQETNGKLITTCVGSGSLVRYDGLILTNAHNTLQTESCPGETLIIAMSIDLDEPPVPRYRASIAQVNEGLDLALLRITAELDGRLIQPADIPPLPFVDLADSSELELDQTITVVGYPSIGNEAVEVLRGTVIGFLAEPIGGDKSWVKTSLVLPGTMTGGGAYNLAGELIGIPTTAPFEFDPESESCFLIEDTNDDRLINNLDRCIPVGSQINVLRPAQFAQALVRGGSLGLEVTNYLELDQDLRSSSRPSFSRLFFSPSVTNGLPSTVVGRMPNDTTSLYLFFDYENMTSETVYEVRVTVDGTPNQTFSLPPVRWSGGTDGLWHIGAGNQTWVNGVYEFRLFIDGTPAGTKSIVIGGVSEPRPTFSNTVFGVTDLSGNPILSNGYVLPSGTTETIARARFIHQNIPPDTPWTVIWYYDGVEIPGARIDALWDKDANGSADTALQPAGGLIPGNYRIDLYLNGRLSTTADFVVSGLPEVDRSPFPQIFEDIRFTSADTVEDAIQASTIHNFRDGAEELFAVFNWQRMATGTLWTMRWSVDGQPFYEQTIPWSNSLDGTNYVTSVTAPGGVPDGTYQLDLFVNGIQIVSEMAEVGIGQLEIDRFADAQGVQLRGKIVDADTGDGIEGATFVLITEDFSVEDFTWDQNQIYSLATTDRNGNFEIDRPLQFGDPYSVIITVDGYLPIAADGYIVEPEDDNPINMVIPLTRD